MFLRTSDFNRSMLTKWAFSLLVPLAIYALLPRSAMLTDPMVAFLASHCLGCLRLGHGYLQ